MVSILYYKVCLAFSKSNKVARYYLNNWSIITFFGCKILNTNSHTQCELIYAVYLIKFCLQKTSYLILNLMAATKKCSYSSSTKITLFKYFSRLCSLMFTVHPIHTEAVTGIVGRAELLSSVFFLLTVLSYKKAALKGQLVHLPLSMVFVLGGILCKEQR